MPTKNYKDITPVTTRDIVALAGYSVSLREAQSWSEKDRKLASDWCYAKYLHAQGFMSVRIPEKPAFLEQFKVNS